MPARTELSLAHASGARHSGWKWGLGLALLVVVGLYCWRLDGDTLSLHRLALHEQRLREYERNHSVEAGLIAFVACTLITALSLPLTVPMALFCGWLFGFWQALALVSIGSTAGSSLAFLLSRYYFRGFVQFHFGPQLSRINSALERDGAFYLFTLRLIPIFPFWIVNLVMGMTPLPLRTFWKASLLGMLPGKSVYAFAGSAFSLRELADNGARGIITPELLIALTLLGLFPLIARKLLERFRQSPTR